jgi:hypothetical protein
MEGDHERMTGVRNGRAGRWFVRGLTACGLIARGALGSLVLLRGAGTFSLLFSSPTALPTAAEPRPPVNRPPSTWHTTPTWR